VSLFSSIGGGGGARGVAWGRSGGGRFVRRGLGGAWKAFLLSLNVPEDEAQLLAKVCKGRDEVKAWADSLAEGSGDLVKEVFWFRRVIRDASMCGVSSKLEEEVLKALIVIHAEIAIQGACLSLLVGVVVGFFKVLDNSSCCKVLAAEVLSLDQGSG